MKLLGQSDASYTPCVGLSVRPFANLQNESDMSFYWVVPPPENSPQEYGKPMKMQHTMVQDPCLAQDILEQVDSVLEFYKEKEKNPVAFHENFNSDTKLVTKMGRSLLPKFPRDQDERLWRHIRLSCLGEEKDSSLPDPLISHASFGDGHSETNKALNGFDVADDEEEIDDDEDGALMRRGGGGRRSSRTVSTHSSNGIGGGLTLAQQMAAAGTGVPLATTDEVISMLLQRQAPVAPMAHGASQRPASAVSDDRQQDEAPLDFSTR